jgi:hypothetical protein
MLEQLCCLVGCRPRRPDPGLRFIDGLGIHLQSRTSGPPPRKCPYFPGFLWVRLRSLTPGAPPFSSVNSTPAASKARRTAKSLAAVIDVSSAVSSARRIVVTPTDDAFARSAALQRMRARAARIWALVSDEEGMLTYHLLMYRLYHMGYSIRGRDGPR